MVRSRSKIQQLALGMLAAAALGRSPAVAATTRVFAWGDSITYGYYDGTNAGNDCTIGAASNDPYETCGYPGRLASRLDDSTKFSPVYDIDVVNLGKGGDTTGEALSRIDRETWTCPCDALAQPCRPNSLKYWVCNGTVQPEDLFVLMEGTNDISTNVSLETIGANLLAIAAKAQVYALNIVISTVIPRHTDACVDSSNNKTENLNADIASLAASEGWPKVDPYGRLDALTGLFNNYYQDWDDMKCADPAPVCNASNPCDPVGHPNQSGYNKLTYDATGSTYAKTFESVVRSALPPRLTLTTPTPPLTSGVSLPFSVTLHDVATFAQTVELTWDFGDGTIETQSISSSPAARNHTYSSSGNFTVTVTAEHANGGTRAKSAGITVAAGTAIFADGFEGGSTSNWVVGSG